MASGRISHTLRLIAFIIFLGPLWPISFFSPSNGKGHFKYIRKTVFLVLKKNGTVYVYMSSPLFDCEPLESRDPINFSQ